MTRGQDVDEFMQSISPAAFDELLAFDLVEGVGNERLINTIAIGFASVLSALSGKSVKPEHLIPTYRPRPKSRTYEAMASEQIAAIRSSLGGM